MDEKPGEREIFINCCCIVLPVVASIWLSILSLFPLLMLGTWSCVVWFGPPSKYKKHAPNTLLGCALGLLVFGFCLMLFAQDGH